MYVRGYRLARTRRGPDLIWGWDRDWRQQLGMGGGGLGDLGGPVGGTVDVHQEAQQDVSTGAVLSAMAHGPQLQLLFEIQPARLHLAQLPVP